MPRLATFADLYTEHYTLGLYCIECDRWGEADLKNMVAAGSGDRILIRARFRCTACGELVEKQLRPPVPAIGSAVAYI